MPYADKEKQKKYQAEHYQRTKRIVYERSKAWKLKNPEKVIRHHREYKIRNKDVYQKRVLAYNTRLVPYLGMMLTKPYINKNRERYGEYMDAAILSFKLTKEVKNAEKLNGNKLETNPMGHFSWCFRKENRSKNCKRCGFAISGNHTSG
jgi:hypothetical protein